MIIALASDHAGYCLKMEIGNFLTHKGYEYRDFGTENLDSCDYAVYAQKACDAVIAGECDLAILCCGTGVGMSMAANKVKGIRCVVCSDCFSAAMSREHNNANVLALGERVVGVEVALMIVETWLTHSFEGGRHQRRVDQIMAIEQGQKLY